jgi:DNA-binding response OmpR family regulator
MKILVADDDEEILRLLEIGLRPAGMQVFTADDAWKAFELAKKELPDAILLDIAMPKGSGLDVLKLLKASPGTAHIPVVVISGSSDTEISAQVKALGAADYVAKPFDIPRIQSVLAAYLRR